MHGQTSAVGWPRGEATDCKSVYTGSNPVPTSKQLHRAIGAVVARFLDTEEVTGSNPVSPTKFPQVRGCFHNDTFWRGTYEEQALSFYDCS